MPTLTFNGLRVAAVNSANDDGSGGVNLELDQSQDLDGNGNPYYGADDVIEITIADEDVAANGEFQQAGDGEVTVTSIKVNGVELLTANDKVKFGGGGDTFESDAYFFVEGQKLFFLSPVYTEDFSDSVEADGKLTLNLDERLVDLDINATGTIDGGTVEEGDGVFNVYAMTPGVITDSTDFTDNGIITGTSSGETIFGGISATDPDAGIVDDDTIQGDAGNDTIFAGIGTDQIDAGSGDDTIYAGAGADTVYGGTGNDTVFGGAGSDTLYGGVGDDHIILDIDGDLAFGGAGDDTIVLGGGDDTLTGGSGSDTFVLSVADYSDLGTAAEIEQALLDLNLAGMDSWQAAQGYTGPSGTDNTATASSLDVDALGDRVDDSLKWLIGAQDAQDAEDAVEAAIQAYLDANPGQDVSASQLRTIAYDTLAETNNSFVSGIGGYAIYKEAHDQLSTSSNDDLETTTLSLEDQLLARATHDQIEDFELGTDTLDLSAHDYLGGTTLSTNDVKVTDTAGDGTGDAVLTFPNGSTVTLKGVSVYDLDPEALEGMGFAASDDAPHSRTNS